MAFYYRLDYVEEVRLMERLAEEVRSLQQRLTGVKEGFCFFAPDSEEAMYFSCAHFAFSAPLFDVELALMGINIRKISKEEFIEAICTSGKILGCKWFLKCIR